MNKKDLTGQLFGNLKVLYEGEPYYTSGMNKKTVWVCECQCDDKPILSFYANQLLSNNTHCCAKCLSIEKSERAKIIHHKTNKYDLTSFNYGVGYTAKGEEFWFDLDDYKLIKEYCWYKHHKYFVAKTLINGKRKEIGLHKIIMDDIQNEFDIDHIKTEYKFDNRKLNLRKANRSQNNSNSCIQINNTSGCTGVQWKPRDQVWESWIRCNRKAIYLGRFNDYENAVKARKEAEKIYYKDFSYDKSQQIYEERIKEN